MTTAPVEMSKSALWDFMRTQSLDYEERHGEWAASDADAFQGHLEEFTASVMQPGTAEFTAGNEYTIVSGEAQSRWCLEGSPGTATAFIVRHTPFRGEIVLLDTSVAFAVLNTNAFVRQWSAAWRD